MTTHGFSLFDTAIGRCGIAWGERGIVGVHLPGAREPETRARVLARFPDDPLRNADAAFAFLQSRGILTRKMGAYGLPQHLRITIGTGPEMETVAAALAEFTAAS